MPAGSDISTALPPIAIALAGIDPAWPELARASPGTAAGLKDTLRTVSMLDVRWVQLDATHPAMRPRDLDRSARRDLAATLRRLELSCCGLDMFVPPEHFASTQNVDRAAAAVISAIELAADLAALSGGAVVARRAEGDTCVSLTLPPNPPSDVLASLASAAQRHGVRLADHGLPIGEQAQAPGPIGVGLDPAGCQGAGFDPVALASSLGDRLVSARLSDTSRTLGALRVAPASAQGRLDVLAYRVALMTSASAARLRAVVLDLRGVSPRESGLAGVIAGVLDAAVTGR